MKIVLRILMVSAIVFGFMTVPMNAMLQSVLAAPANCADSLSSSTLYMVRVCITSPVNGDILSTNATITATASVLSGPNPGVQRMTFYLNTTYLLTAFTSPYTFTLPTSKYVDGSYTLSGQALMRDGFTTSQASISILLSTGTSTPPVNTNTFTPTSGNPAGGQPFVVAAVGDGASGENNSKNVVNLINSLNPNLFLYLGDVYDSGSIAEFYNWYGTGTANFASLRAITDPTIGNHEYSNGIGGAGYFDYWNNVSNYYSFDAGGWHFISLNSNRNRIDITSSGAEYKWLAKDLSANLQPCTIVFYHQPLFNIGPEGPTTDLAAIWSLLAQHSVSIVLNGHDHDYQHWVALDGNGQPSPTGITEFVAGGGGHGLQTIVNSDSRVAYWTDANPAGFGALFLTLNPTYASFSYRSALNGSVLDSGVINCRGLSLPTHGIYLPIIFR